MPDDERARQIGLMKQETATLYEGLTLRQMFEARRHEKPLPYDAASIARLKIRLLDLWPELKPLYAGSRAERRGRR